MVDWERVIRDVGKLRASLRVENNTEGAVERWDARHNKAFGRGTRAARIAGGIGTGRWYRSGARRRGEQRKNRLVGGRHREEYTE
jgi:hypothetical protein